MDSYKGICKIICRVCLTLSKSDKMVPLFDKNSKDGLSCYGKSVMTFANISLKSDDNFPAMMCRNCVLLLKQAIRFKFKCENSDMRLENLIKVKGYFGQDYCEVLCQYMLFKYYFPEKTINPQSESIDKDKSVVKTSVIDQKVSKNVSNLQYRVDDKKQTNINKANEKLCKFYKYCDLNDFHYDLNTDLQVNIKPYEDEILDKLENLFDSEIDRNVSSYVSKSKHNVRKKETKRTVSRKDFKPIVQKPKIWLCMICDKVLRSRIMYDRHMQRHNGCRFMCESCGKLYPTQSELNVHQVSSHGIGPYLECNYCCYKAPTKLNLIEHIRLHTGERPYTCEKCGLTFRRRILWQNHLVYHKEKNVQCPHCPKKYFRRLDMLAHINNIHDRTYVYMCNKCGVMYAKSATVRRHLTEKHGVSREMQGKIIRVKRNNSEKLLLK